MESSVQCCKSILLGKVAVAREMNGLVCSVLDTQSLHFRKNGLPSGLTPSVECGSHNNCRGSEEMGIGCYGSLNENGHYTHRNGHYWDMWPRGSRCGIVGSRVRGGALRFQKPKPGLL